MLNNNYDIIVIGSGLGGLTSAATFAQNGLKVLVVEKHDKPGGFATKFKRDGFTFDVSLHNFGPLYDNYLINKIFNELELSDKIEFLPYDSYQRLIFPDDDIVIEKGLYGYIEELKKRFPHETDGIDKIFEDMTGIRDEFDEIEKLDILLEQLEEEFPMLPVKFPLLVKLVYTTYEKLLDTYIQDGKLKGVLGSLWWLYGIPPEKVASILYSVPSVNYYKYSGGYIKNTSQHLSNELSLKIARCGGEILLNTEIDRIIVSDKKAVGVATVKGDIYHANTIISNIAPQVTFNTLVVPENVDRHYLKKINKLELSLSCIQLYVGIDCNPEVFGFYTHSITIYKSYNHNENYQFAVNGDYNNAFFSATKYENLETKDQTKRFTINIMSLDCIKNWEKLSKDAYNEKKQKVIQIIIDRFEEVLPGMKEHIVYKDLSTPVTVKRYTGHPDGSIYGATQTVSQSGINRLSYKTPVTGLYLCGSSVYPGAGYSSVITSGYNISKKIMREVKPI